MSVHRCAKQMTFVGHAAVTAEKLGSKEYRLMDRKYRNIRQKCEKVQGNLFKEDFRN